MKNASETNKGIEIMVCVTTQKSCDKLIAKGVERAAGQGALHVVHCVQTGHNFMGTPFEGDAIQYLFTAAQLAGAELDLLRAKDVENALVEYAVSHGIHVMVLGAGSSGSQPKDSLIARLQRRLPEVVCGGGIKFLEIGKKLLTKGRKGFIIANN